MMTKALAAFAILFLTTALVSAQDDKCLEPLGAEDGRITDDQFKASSERKYHYPHLARLNYHRDERSWCANYTDKNPWIKIVLHGTHNITAIAIQGRNGPGWAGWYVKKFEIVYLRKGTYRDRYISYKNVFDGPKSGKDIVKIPVDFQTSEVYVKPVPGESYPPGGLVCLRMELYGCPVIVQPPKPDYCKEKNFTCAHYCVNGDQAAECKCSSGYQLTNDNRTCEDVDECSSPDLNACDNKTTTCFNVRGNYHCVCQKGLEMKLVNDNNCVDIDECISNMHKCDHICKNTYKSYYCKCRDGYALQSDNKTCVDINECTDGTNACDISTTTCKNTLGGYQCLCNAGLKYANQTKNNCIDIDECSRQDHGGCDHGCHNMHGSYYCSCRNGTKLFTDNKQCLDINECKENKHNCQQICRNSYGSYSCDCNSGYQRNNDKKTCSDINECTIGKSPCSHHCANTIGSFTCSCDKGYEIGHDGRTCVDFDECKAQVDNCDDGTATCYNTIGSFTCRCKPGFKQDPVTGNCAAKKCPPLYPAKNGYLSPASCSKANSQQYKDVCSFKCFDGFELNSASVQTATCTSDGIWSFRGGLQPICQPIHCPAIQPGANMQVIPQSCQKDGGEYKKDCQIYCDSGYRLVGINKVTCRMNGQYDGSFNNTKCVQEKSLKCPKDVTIILPLGAKDTILPLERLSEKLEADNLESRPSGVLTGHYRFTSQVQSQQVILKAKPGTYSTSSCSFHVKVEDREPPKVKSCPTENVYVTLNGVSDPVTWPEPKFEDNVAIKKMFVNLLNGQKRPEQVYYVYYAASDEYGNEAVCRFFVHVKAKYCKKENIPGAEDAKFFWIGGGIGDTLTVFLSCDQDKMLSANISGASIFRCKNGAWPSTVPDCVKFLGKTNGSCPKGYNTIMQPFVNIAKCVQCPKGTMKMNGGCVPCPLGSYQDQPGSSKCTLCPAGTTSLKFGEKKSSGCQFQCTPGEYSMTGLYGSKGCERCPGGSFQNLHGQKSCKVCPRGGTSSTGAKSEDECKLPARVSRIFPERGFVTVKAGKNITVDCYGTGSPRPYMQIKSVEQLPPESFRGKVLYQPIVTGNKHISGLRMTITGATKYDNAIYRCSADNKSGTVGGFDQREISVQVE